MCVDYATKVFVKFLYIIAGDIRFEYTFDWPHSDYIIMVMQRRIDNFECGDSQVVVSGSATPNAAINTLTAVIRKMPITVKLLILSARHICSIFFTLYRLFSIRPKPTATYSSANKCKR